MSLTFPLNSSQAGNAAQNNLSILLCAKNTSEDVTSEAVRNAFEAYQNSKLGFVHYAKKFTASIAAYGTVLGLPIAASLGGMYWLFKDVIHNPSLIADYVNPLQFVSVLSKNQPAIDPNTTLIGGLSSFSTPRSCLVTLGVIATADRAFNKAYDISPIKSAAKWSLQMMSTVLLYAAYKAGELAGAAYLQEEEAKNESRKYSHTKIIEQLQTIYDNIADGFFSDYEKVSDSPKEMVRFKHMAEQLEENFPYIKAKLGELELKPFEVNQIMGKLSMVVNTIKDSALGFRQGGKDVDTRFNIELIKTLPNRDIPSIAIPNDIKNHIKIADYNDLRTLHTIKSLAVSGAAGAAVAAVSDIAIAMLATLAVRLTGFDPNTAFQTLMAVLAAPISLNEGAKIAKKIFNEYCEERATADLRKEEQVVTAHEKLLKIYDGLASYFKMQSIQFKYNPFAMMILTEDAKSIFPKLPLLEAEIDKIGVMNNRYDITERLRTTLAEIIAANLPY